MAGDRPGQPVYKIFSIERQYIFNNFKFWCLKFNESYVQRPQIWVLFQDAVLFYCMLYTDCQSGRTAAIFAQTTCCCWHQCKLLLGVTIPKMCQVGC